jgi:hypothetical protein
MTDKSGEDTNQASISVGHELSDAEARPLAYAGLVLAVILILIGISMAGTFYFFAKEQKLGPPATPFENARSLPPLPRLQVDPKMELKEYRDSQREILNSYGWVDRAGGVVRIPVDRAMELVLARGLPIRPKGAAPVNDRATGSGSLPGPVESNEDEPAPKVARPAPGAAGAAPSEASPTPEDATPAPHN